MDTVLVAKVEQLSNIIQIDALERMKYRLSDAIREGCMVSGPTTSWSDGGDNLCALSAAVVAAKTRGYI